MPRIRVALAEMPVLLRDIVQSILATQPSVVELEPTPVSLEDVASDDALARTDVLICSEGGTSTLTLTRTLYAHSRLRLIAIRDDRHGALLYELRPHQSELAELSPTTLLRAVHGSTANSDFA